MAIPVVLAAARPSMLAGTPEKPPILNWRVVSAVATLSILALSLFIAVVHCWGRSSEAHAQPTPAVAAAQPVVIVPAASHEMPRLATPPTAAANVPPPPPPAVISPPRAKPADDPPADPPPTRSRYGTAVEFVDDPQEAARLALKEDKLLLVLHVAGNFEESCFT